MVIGGFDYQFMLSRIAYSFQGAVTIEYLEAASVQRVRELSTHLDKINEALKQHG